jgi:Fur family transcriptional regulator, ferric uptake regulator
MAFERTECALHQISPWSFAAQKKPAHLSGLQPKQQRKAAGDLFSEALTYLRASGFRVTKPREVIVQAAISFEAPFHAEDLLARARQMDRLISLATVYRTLPMLLDSRLIREIELNREHRYYEVNREQSPAAFHIICTDCHQVVQVHDQCVTLRERCIANSFGFIPMKLNVRIEACCLDWRQSGRCERKEKAASSERHPRQPAGSR